MVLIMLIGYDSTMCHVVRHLTHAPPRCSFRRLRDFYRVEAIDRAHGHPSTNTRHTDGSRGGCRATDPCDAEHRRITAYAGCGTRRHAKNDAAANAHRRVEGWRFSASA